MSDPLRKLNFPFSHALNRRAFIAGGAAALATGVLDSCGGGGSSASSPATPSPTPNPAPTPTPTPTPLSIASISSSSPMALTPITLTLAGFDSTKPFTVSFSDPSGNQIPQTPIRFQSDGTVVIAAPLFIDATKGTTGSFSTTLTVTQNGSKATSGSITVNDLPQLTALGVPLGAVSRAFIIHQEISLGQSINAQQAVSLLPKQSANGQLITHLQTQLLNLVMARNDIDRIVADNTVSIPVGSMPDGTPLAFNADSVAMMDRIIAQYLLVSTNNGTQLPQVVRRRGQKQPAIHAAAATVPTPNPMAVIIQGITTLSGSVSLLTTQQTLATSSSSTLDNWLSIASTGTSFVGLGATVLGLGAAAVGAPAIATFFGAVAVGAAFIGLATCAASIGNDLYNIGSNAYGLYSGDPKASVTDLEKATASLVSDTVVGYLNAEGMGGLSKGLTAAADSMFGSVFKATAEDAELGFAALATSTDNLMIQTSLSEDGASATESAQSATSSEFGIVDGTVDVSNSEGPTLSGLTGVGVGNDATATIDLTSMAAPDGTYNLLLPIGSQDLDYASMLTVAFDPVDYYDAALGGNSVPILGSSVVNLSGVNPNTPIAGPSLAAVCNDTDAGDPDGDDPDCD